ncbi:MAG: hypothetical protein WC979_01985 [Candidatus Pacearchaeota archaeon]|jgi:hypothetical protein|nr:hypothetical protein [Clostridia bacterium]
MKQRIPTLDEFINENANYINEAADLEREPQPAYVAFKKVVGPLFAGISIYGNNGDQSQSKIFMYLGDRGQKLQITGMQILADVESAVPEITQTVWSNGPTFDIPSEESIKIAKKLGFSKKGSNDYEIQVSKPSDAPAIIIKFLKAVMPKFIK